MESVKTVSIVIGSYNRKRFLRLAIESVRAELERCRFHGEIIVVDGGSTDGSVAWLTKQKDIISIIQHNRGTWQGKLVECRSWGYFMNLGFKCAQGKYVCMLSDDCLVIPGAIENGIHLFEESLDKGEKTGAMAFYWRNWPSQENYWVGVTFGTRMFVNHGLYLREALEAVGYIDEDVYSFYHADGDLCLRMWEHGYTCMDSPESFIEHYSHANEVVRAENLSRQHLDWCHYEQVWEHLGRPEKDWIEISYKDPTNTARQFNKLWGK